MVGQFVSRCIEVIHRAISSSFIGFEPSQLIAAANQFSNITKYVPRAAVVVDGTEIKIPASSDKKIQKDHFSGKKKIHSVNVLVVVLLNGRCIYVSDASPTSNDQKQWNKLNLRQHFENIPVGIIGDAGFHFNQIELLKRGRPSILGYRIQTPKEHHKIHNKVVSQLRIVVENFIGDR